MAENNCTLDVPALFHTILFAYQKKLKEVLDSGDAIFVHPVLETINKIDRENGLNSIRGKNLDEILENFATDMIKSQFFKKAWFEKVEPESYNFYIEGCIFADKVHGFLYPKDVACPMALVAMAIYQKTTNKKVKLAESVFSPGGCKTPITAQT